MKDKKHIRSRWTRVIVTLAILLVVAFTFGEIWAFVVVGLIGMIAGYMMGFMSGETDGRNYAFKYLFGDDINDKFEEYFESRLQETLNSRGDDINLDELLARFRSSGVGIPLADPKTNHVKQETMRELQELRDNGLS